MRSAAASPPCSLLCPRRSPGLRPSTAAWRSTTRVALDAPPRARRRRRSLHRDTTPPHARRRRPDGVRSATRLVLELIGSGKKEGTATRLLPARRGAPAPLRFSPARGSFRVWLRDICVPEIIQQGDKPHGGTACAARTRIFPFFFLPFAGRQQLASGPQ
jgi:hypothetical protein